MHTDLLVMDRRHAVPRVRRLQIEAPPREVAQQLRANGVLAWATGPRTLVVHGAPPALTTHVPLEVQGARVRAFARRLEIRGRAADAALLLARARERGLLQ
jgi:hypothetical protein